MDSGLEEKEEEEEREGADVGGKEILGEAGGGHRGPLYICMKFKRISKIYLQTRVQGWEYSLINGILACTKPWVQFSA